MIAGMSDAYVVLAALLVAAAVVLIPWAYTSPWVNPIGFAGIVFACTLALDLVMMLAIRW